MKDYNVRRKDREIDESSARQIISDGEYGVLSTVGEDGFPYGVPVNYVFDGEKIYFHCAKNSGHKQDNLTFCNKISFNVVGKTEIVSEKFTTKYSSVIVFGKAQKTEENKRYALELLVKKYSPDFLKEGENFIKKSFEHTDVFEITILKISAKAHT